MERVRRSRRACVITYLNLAVVVTVREKAHHLPRNRHHNLATADATQSNDQQHSKDSGLIARTSPHRPGRLWDPLPGLAIDTTSRSPKRVRHQHDVQPFPMRRVLLDSQACADFNPVPGGSMTPHSHFTELPHNFSAGTRDNRGFTSFQHASPGSTSPRASTLQRRLCI
jgi:hypothetical protein